jgi:hypothetical protein
VPVGAVVPVEAQLCAGAGLVVGQVVDVVERRAVGHERDHTTRAGDERRGHQRDRVGLVVRHEHGLALRVCIAPPPPDDGIHLGGARVAHTQGGPNVALVQRTSGIWPVTEHG